MFYSDGFLVGLALIGSYSFINGNIMLHTTVSGIIANSIAIKEPVKGVKSDINIKPIAAEKLLIEAKIENIVAPISGGDNSIISRN